MVPPAVVPFASTRPAVPTAVVVTVRRVALVMFAVLVAVIVMSLRASLVHDAIAASVVATFDSVAGSVERIGEVVVARDGGDERKHVEVMIDDLASSIESIESTIDAFRFVEIRVGRCSL